MKHSIPLAMVPSHPLLRPAERGEGYSVLQMNINICIRAIVCVTACTLLWFLSTLLSGLLTEAEGTKPVGRATTEINLCARVCVIVSVISLLFFVDTSILISTTVGLDISILHNTHACVCLHKSGTMLSTYLVPKWWNGLMNYPLSIYNSNFLMSRLVRRLTTKHTRHTLEYWMLIFHQIDR